MINKKIIKLAASRNILCYDQDAESGEITYRLMKIMKEASIDNKSGKITKFFLTTEEQKQYYIDLVSSLAKDDYFLIIAECANGKYLAGSF